MSKQIVIGKMFLEETKERNVRICSIIKSDKEDYNMWFEIEKKYKEYILLERADSFLVAILPYAIKHELDIIVENKISSRLYYQLTTYVIPIFCETFKKRNISIKCELDSNIYNKKKAVGTAVSCGVDSLYTIAKHTKLVEKEFNITHLTFFNAGASGEYGGEEARNLYKKRVKSAEKFAEKNKFEFVTVDSNMNEFLMMNHFKTSTFRTLACVLVLQKLFSIYYLSSGGDHFNDTGLYVEDEDVARADLLLVQALSTEDITFYCTGIEKVRIEKVKEITKYEPSYESLNVCLNEENNCGFCNKCKRTIMELYAIGKLDLYKDVFDVDKFNKKKYKYFIWLNRGRRKKDNFCIEIYNEFKKKNIKIPIYIKLLAFIPNKKEIKKTIFKIIPKNKIKKILGKKPSINDGWID